MYNTAYCYWPSSVVCRSVCRTVIVVSRAKRLNRSRCHLGWRLGWAPPRESCVSWGPNPPWKGATLRGKVASHCKVSLIYEHSAVIYAKTAEPIKMSFGFWARMGPRNHTFLAFYAHERFWITLCSAAFNDCSVILPQQVCTSTVQSYWSFIHNEIRPSVPFFAHCSTETGWKFVELRRTIGNILQRRVGNSLRSDRQIQCRRSRCRLLWTRISVRNVLDPALCLYILLALTLDLPSRQKQCHWPKSKSNHLVPNNCSDTFLSWSIPTSIKSGLIMSQPLCNNVFIWLSWPEVVGPIILSE